MISRIRTALTKRAQKRGVLDPVAHLANEAVRDSVAHFRPQMEASMLFQGKPGLWSWASERAMAHAEAMAEATLFLEFGVAKGKSINHLASRLQRGGHRIYGFDAFEGLEEDWTGQGFGRAAGAYGRKGVAPRVASNVSLVVGWVQDTLPGFLKDHPEPIALAHLDLDTYTPTRFVLSEIRPRLRPGSILVFDELYAYPGWKHHAYRALLEVFDESEIEYLAFGPENVAVALR